MKKIFILIMSIFVLTACGKETKNIKDVTFNSYDTNFEIVANSNWIEVADKGQLNANASIEIYNQDDQKYLIAIMESKKDIPWKYEEYKNYILEHESTIYGFNKDEQKDIKIGEYDTKYVSFVTDIDGKSFYMNIYIVETKNYFGQIIIWTKSSLKEQVDEEFNKIVQSFKEVEDTKKDATTE